MGPDKESPVAFLENAKQAIQNYDQIVKDLQAQREAETQARKAVDQLRRETQDKVEKTIKSRQDEINVTYDRQIMQIDNRLRKVQAKREKARNQGVRERIAAETEPLLKENRAIQKDLAALVEANKAPGILRSDLFYVLFKPSGIKEILLLILCFVLIFAALPIGVFLLIPEHKTWQLILIYLVDIFLFGGFYVWMNTRTNGRFHDIVQQGRGMKNRIRENKRRIRKLRQGIKADSNDSGYHLEEYDDEITRAQRDREEVLQQKQNALSTFESVTKTIIRDEIETAARPKQEELEAALSNATGMRIQLEQQEKEGALALSGEFVQYLGQRHMNVGDIEQMMATLETGEASSITEAVQLLEHPPRPET